MMVYKRPDESCVGKKIRLFLASMINKSFEGFTWNLLSNDLVHLTGTSVPWFLNWFPLVGSQVSMAAWPT